MPGRRHLRCRNRSARTLQSRTGPGQVFRATGVRLRVEPSRKRWSAGVGRPVSLPAQPTVAGEMPD